MTARFPSLPGGIAAPVLLVCTLAPGAGPSEAEVFSAPPFAGMREPIVEAMLYNPPLDEATWRVSDKPEATVRRVDPRPAICGHGLENGDYALSYRIEAVDKPLLESKAEVTVQRRNTGTTNRIPEAGIRRQSRFCQSQQHWAEDWFW